MFDEMPREGCHQIVTMMTVLFACMHGGLVDTGMSLLKRMEPGDIRVVDEAHALMEQRMLMEANVVIWGTLLGACERHENVRVGQ
uniref:Pentatricopeptide repeat-containing protein n=1 Tax=Oryza barthii TaxID=65489 RepID=A0A0D3ETJ0_9ORYZ